MIISELANAWRSVRHRPASSALVVMVLAIGLGCVMYVGGMINGLLIKPLPFHDPDRLFDAGIIDNDASPDTDNFDALRTDEFMGWRQYVSPVASVAGIGRRTINLSDNERPERYAGATVTANLFSTLGVAPAIGRDFVEADELPGAAPVVMLSDAVWRTRYLADPAIVGREVRINAQPARVIGVMPPDFSFPYSERLWIPATLQRDSTADYFEVVLRPHPQTSMPELRAALAAWYAEAQRLFPEAMRSRASGVGIQPLAYRFVDGGTRALFGVMLAAVILVLLLACANATHLLLSQTAARRQELWLRTALGANRGRLMTHLLAQSGLLTLLAMLLALPLAQGLISATDAVFRGSDEEGPPHWMHFDIDTNVMLLSLCATVLTALFTASLPALRAGADAGQSGGARVHSGRDFVRTSRILVVGQVALSCALLISATVMVQSVVRLSNFDLGIQTGKVLTARIALFDSRYPDDAAVSLYQQRLVERLQRDPEVQAVTLSSSLPGLIGEDIDVLERGLPRPEAGLPNIGYSRVDAEFADTLGATLLEGRFFTRADGAGDARVVVVDENFARRFSPGSSVVGKTFVLESGSIASHEATVVGVVRPVQMDDIDDPIQPSVFEPMQHNPPRYFSLLVRTRGTPLDFADGLQRAVAEIDPDTPAYWVRDYNAVLREATLGIRILANVFSGFGAVALLLAAAGLYGVVAFSVARRTREIGVLRALGAPDSRVLSSVAGRSLWQMVAGLLLGVALGIPLSRMLAAPLSHLVSTDVSGWLPVLPVLLVIALLAVWIPARRALRVEPVVALRQD